MRKFIVKFWAVIFFLGWCFIESGFLHAETGKKTVSSSELEPYSSNELLIHFKAETKLTSPNLFNSTTASGNSQLDSLNRHFLLSKVIPLFPYLVDTSISFESEITTQTFLFKFARGISMDILIKSYESLEIIEFAEVNYHYFADHSTSNKYSDLLQSQLEKALRSIIPNHSVITGIIDTGIDSNLKSFISSLWMNPGEKLDGEDNDANGFIDDIWGWNFVDHDLMNTDGLNMVNHPIDECGHGTQIAEIIAQIGRYSTSNNRIKNNNQLMILKAGALFPNGKIIFTAFDLARAIIYAANNGARIINLSGNNENSSLVLQQAIDYATNKGCIIIAAAGDKNSNQPHYPAAFEHVWAITATDHNDRKLQESNSGQWIEMAAPGLLNKNFSFSDSVGFIPSATAIAAANVSGLAGLLLSSENITNNDSLKRRILWSSDNIYPENRSYSGKLGAGRINILRAINSQHQPNIIIQKLTYQKNKQQQYLQPFNIVPITINIKNLSSLAESINVKLTTNDPYLSVLKSEINIPRLNYKQEFSNEFNPFTLIIHNDYPAEHEAELMISIQSLNDFSLKQVFSFTNQISQPKDLTFVSDSLVILKWTGNTEFVGYQIYRKENDQQDYSRISELPILECAYTDASIRKGQQYYYYITGIDSSRWESPPSNIVTIRLPEQQKFIFCPTRDTLINNEDSIRFSALSQFEDIEDYSFRWLLNGKAIVSDSNSLFFNSYSFNNNQDDTITVIIDNTELDTTITHHWVITVKNSINIFEINSIFPATDTTLNAGDSLKLHISVKKTGSDSLTFIWQINDKIVDQAEDTVFVLFADSLPDSNNLIKVSISNRDTIATFTWNIYIKPSSKTIDQFFFSPKSDTTIYEGDSLSLSIQIKDKTDSFKNFVWQINGIVDTSAHQTGFKFAPDYFSAGTDTILLYFEIGDSAAEHQWLVTILNRSQSPEILSYSTPKDTIIAFEDTLKFFVKAFDPDQDSLCYRWFINWQPDTAAVDSFYTFFKTRDGFEPDTISVQISDDDTAIFHRWVVHYFTVQNHAPQILSYSPPVDSMLTQADSIQFCIQCHDPDGDSLHFTWSVNGWIDSSAHESAYWYQNLDSTFSDDTLNVTISDADSFVTLGWIIRPSDNEIEPKSKLITWYPEQDSLLGEADSLVFMIQNANDSCHFQWQINSRMDAMANGSIFVYHQSADSIKIDTVKATVIDGDSLFYHEWYIHHFNLKKNRSPVILSFLPGQNIITAIRDDSLKLSAQILEGDFIGLDFQWSVNHKIDTSAVDTIFYYYPEYFLLTPDTIELVVSSNDTTISHKWFVHFYQQQTLPAPHLIFPVEGNRICEEDQLTWENDSTLAQIDSTAEWNYLVQISLDSSFSGVISTDSCHNTTSITLNNLAKFDQIPVGKPLFWRVKVCSGILKTSEFTKNNTPFNYYPQFAQLESFTGEQKDDGTIDLTWTTRYEDNCAGFKIYRSELKDDYFEPINEYLIAGQGKYSYHDVTSMAGKTYYYKLENVSTYGNRKFHQTISVTASIPAKFSLYPNYPNPFNARTSFKYEIPIASHVRIEVCNVLGRKVKTLVNEKKEAGFYDMFWDGIDDRGESVVSGIYFYSLITNKGKITRKMVVVR